MTIHVLFFLSTGLLVLSSLAATTDGEQFAYSGFIDANLTLDGAATITATGLIELTNTASTHQKGHAFHPTPLRLRASPDGAVRSFSATFVFGIVSSYTDFSTHGLVLVFTPRKSLPGALTDQYLGITSIQNDGKATNHMFAVELDTVQNIEFHDTNANHVGIDINGLSSVESHDAGYYDDKSGSFTNLSLISRDAMQVWVDYDGDTVQINVTMAPLGTGKPKKPLVFATRNLSEVLMETSYIGFSSSTGPVNTRHYVLGWSFGMNNNGSAPAIDATKLPKLPQLGSKPRSKVLEITLPLATAALVLAMGTAMILLLRRRLRYTEVREDWEMEFGPHRFTYKDLFHATKGFKDKYLIGAGGFGMVYKGVLPTSGLQVAVKKVSHGSKQGMKEFVAEIVSIGRIRHRNLVQLLGYCRRKDELILVYDYIPNGSLDKYLYSDDTTLDWAQRFHVIKGVASGLHFLHERWEKVVLHRDIKTSNVLLDKEMNGRLGDFGLAKLYEHGTNPQTSRVVGTTGYLAPELLRSGKATPLTDVFAFGTFILEVTCGQRPVKQDEQLGKQILLVDWVLEHWHSESLAETVDPRLQEEYNAEEVCQVLKIGLLCSHPSATSRPSMQQVLQYLDGEVPIPQMTRTDLRFNVLALMQREGLQIMSSACSSMMMSAAGTISDLSGGR